MGNTIRSFIDVLPPVIVIDAPKKVETGAVDRFNKAIEDANRNATTGVVTEIARAAKESNDTTDAILANIISQKCDGDKVCSNLEIITGDCRKGVESTRCEKPIGDLVWDSQCKKKVTYFGGRKFGLRDGTAAENDEAKEKCEGRNTMCEWESTRDRSSRLYNGICKKKSSCAEEIINGRKVGSGCGLQGETQDFMTKSIRRVCWGVDSETSRGCIHGDINDPDAPTVDKGCMKFKTLNKGETCDAPLEDDPRDPQKAALLRACIDTVSKTKPIVAWSGVEDGREDLERLDKLLYAAKVYDTAKKCVDKSATECSQDKNCVYDGSSCLPKSIDSVRNECSAMRSIQTCGGEFCSWDDGTQLCVPNKKIVEQKRDVVRNAIDKRMRENVKTHCLERMCLDESSFGFKSTCVPYFKSDGVIAECPAGFAERPTDVSGRRYPAPACEQARRQCKEDIEKDLKTKHINDISQTIHTGINRGISRAECERKGCMWKENDPVKCFNAEGTEPCGNCLIKNIEQENVAVMEKARAREEVVSNKIGDLDLVIIQEALRNVGAQATGGFDATKQEDVQNIGEQCMKAATNIKNSVMQDCLGGEGSKMLLLNLLNQHCSDVDAGCVISDIKQSTELKSVDSCLQQVKVSNETTQSMRQALEDLKIQGPEAFESRRVKIIVWSAVILGAITSLALWAKTDVYMGLIPIFVGAFIVFMTGARLYAPEHTTFNDDQILMYASVRREEGDDPFGAAAYDTYDLVTLKQARRFCLSSGCKSFFWEARDDRNPDALPKEYNEGSECSEDNFPCCPHFCASSGSSMCTEKNCCPPGYRKVAEKQGSFERVNCVKCKEKRGKLYLYETDFSENEEFMKGFHQPEKVRQKDLLCLNNIRTFAGFAKPGKTDVAVQGKQLARKAVVYGGLSIAALFVLDIVTGLMAKAVKK